jgi:hypothetical protein
MKDKVSIPRSFVMLTSLIIFIFSFQLQTFSQTSKVVKGRVTDARGEPLAGVSILVKGTSTAVVSDAEGNYRISLADNSILVFSYVGFNSIERPVNNLTTLNVVPLMT